MIRKLRWKFVAVCMGLVALVLSAVPEILRAINDYRMVLYGLLMVLMMIYRPQGFWGMQRRLKNAYKYSVGGKDPG